MSSVLQLLWMPIGCWLATVVASCCFGTLQHAKSWRQSRLTQTSSVVWQSLLTANPSWQAAGIKVWSSGASRHCDNQWSNSSVTMILWEHVQYHPMEAGCTLAAMTSASSCGTCTLDSSWQACSLTLVGLQALRCVVRCWYPAVTIKLWICGTLGTCSFLAHCVDTLNMSKLWQWALMAVCAYSLAAVKNMAQGTTVFACGTLLLGLSWQYYRHTGVQFVVSQWAQMGVWQLPAVKMAPFAYGIWPLSLFAPSSKVMTLMFCQCCFHELPILWICGAVFRCQSLYSKLVSLVFKIYMLYMLCMLEGILNRRYVPFFIYLQQVYMSKPNHASYLLKRAVDRLKSPRASAETKWSELSNNCFRANKNPSA